MALLVKFGGVYLKRTCCWEKVLSVPLEFLHDRSLLMTLWVPHSSLSKWRAIHSLCYCIQVAKRIPIINFFSFLIPCWILLANTFFRRMTSIFVGGMGQKSFFHYPNLCHGYSSLKRIGW